MKRIVFVLLLSLLILAACGPEPTAVPPTAAPTAAPTEAAPAAEPTADTTFESPLDMANPASVFCVEQGYELEIRDEEGGQVGYCLFPNGAECEEWAFYRGECTMPETYP
jgi:putative hemolysin